MFPQSSQFLETMIQLHLHCFQKREDDNVRRGERKGD